MFRLLSSVNRPLRPHALYSSVYLPALRKVHRAPFQRNELLSVLTTTAFSSKATKNDSDTQIYYGFEYLIDGVESLRSYKPGGYHPIHIGDQLQGRYRIFNKLGYGAYSTTWLARDEQSNKYVAVKICTADSNASMKEADIISFLTRPHCSLEYNPGQAMIPLIFDRFTIHGPNGEHACYVTEPARASLAGLKKGSFKSLFQLDVARSLAAQLVLAVDYVHSQGYVHGDLHLGNVLLTTQPGFDQLSLEQLYETYGPPDQEKVIRVDEKPLSPGVPTHAIAPKWLGKASEDITRAEARILLSDFGEAFAYPKEQKFVSHAPTVYRPPEARFEPETSLSFASDVWTLACAIWYIIAQRLLFESLFATQDNITREHVEALGPLPPEWWTKWEARGKYFTDDGGPVNLDDDDRIRQLDDRFDDSVQYPRTEEGMPAFDARESKAIFDMLRPMLSFRPEHRPTTGRILESEWMVRWALPSFFVS